jgi:hypothetical protein
MLKLVKLDIAGICITISCQQERLVQALGQRYKAFTIFGEVQHNIEIYWEPMINPPVFLMPSTSFDNSGVRLSGPGYTGYYNIPDKKGELRCNTATPVEAVDYYLRVIVSVISFTMQGIMAHGAGILHAGRGYLFIGHSGSGKTTISKLSVDDFVLNDDLVILLPRNEAWVMYSTPFWNPSQIKPKPHMAPLDAMYLLKKDRTVYIEPFKPSQALAEFLTNVPIIISNERYIRSLIDRCIKILETVPAYQLHFLPDQTFWRVIDHLYK